jgi:hypothetical protein
MIGRSITYIVTDNEKGKVFLDQHPEALLLWHQNGVEHRA